MKKILPILAVIALAMPCLAQDSNIKSKSVYSYAGVPANGTSEVDTLTIQTSTSAGTFTITVAGGRTTAPITWSATDATMIADIDAKLEALSVIGSGGVVVSAGTGSSGIGTYLITFTGKNARQDFAALSIGTNSLTGGAAPTLTTTTAGVAATWGDAYIGAVVEDSTNGELYQNISTTAGAPNWQIKGLGFKSGSGGAVTQITSRATAVINSKRSGKVTTTADSLAAATIATHTVTNTTVAVTDTVVISKVSGDVDTFAWVNAVADGSFTVSLYNSHASAADTTAFVYNFTVIKGAID